VRKASDIGAEQNHLWPTKLYEPSAFLLARVVLARTSEPPCFSVIAMPMVAPRFAFAGCEEPSYSEERIRGFHSASSSG